MRRWLVAFGAALATCLVSAAAHAAAEGDDNGSHFWFEMGNLLLLAAVLFYFAKGPVLSYFADRRSEIAGNIEKSEKLLSDAEARLAEWEAKANGLDAEVEEIKRATRAAAETQRDAILADAEQTAERIRASAGAVVEREMLQARHELREEAADMAVEMATQLLRDNVGDADRSRLVDEFIASLESGGSAGDGGRA